MLGQRYLLLFIAWSNLVRPGLTAFCQLPTGAAVSSFFIAQLDYSRIVSQVK